MGFEESYNVCLPDVFHLVLILETFLYVLSACLHEVWLVALPWRDGKDPV